MELEPSKAIFLQPLKVRSNRERHGKTMTIHFLYRVLTPLFVSQLLLVQALLGEDSLEKQFAAIVEQAGNDEGFSGIVVAEQKGEIVASRSFGFADTKSKTPIDSRTLFEIGSVTKPVTALAVITLDRKGILSLDDSISDHLPDVPENCRDITIRHLLQHTSGIPGTNYGPHSVDVAEITKAYLLGGPRAKPGTRFEYWNQGYALLAAIIAKATGQSYQEAVRELVFRPCDMNASCFTGDKPPQGFQVSIGKSTIGANRSALDHPYGNFYGLQYQGMGGIVSNVEDMLEFVKAIRQSESICEKMLQPGPDGSYALGWQLEQLNETHTRIFHSGSVRGFLASVSWYPQHESSIIILANTDAKAGFLHVESSCRQAFETTIIPLPEAQKFDSEFRGSAVGQFTLQSRVVTISEVGEGLQMVIDWGGPMTFGKLAKTSSPTRLRYLDGSGENVIVSLGKKNSSDQFESLEILNSNYDRRK